MQAEIKFTKQASQLDSMQLNKLKEFLEEFENLSIKSKMINGKEGTKGIDLMIGLTITGLIVASFTAVIEFLSYLKESNEKYVINVKIHQKVYILDKKTKKEMIKELQTNKLSNNEKIDISIEN
jgi:hypothetical protein